MTGVNKLAFQVKFKLAKLVEAEYASYGVEDAEFAEYAKGMLKEESVTKYHIGSCRRDLGIPSTLEVRKAEKIQSADKTWKDCIDRLDLQVDSLRRQVETLTKRLDVFMNAGTVRG